MVEDLQDWMRALETRMEALLETAAPPVKLMEQDPDAWVARNHQATERLIATVGAELHALRRELSAKFFERPQCEREALRRTAHQCPSLWLVPPSRQLPTPEQLDESTAAELADQVTVGLYLRAPFNDMRDTMLYLSDLLNAAPGAPWTPALTALRDASAEVDELRPLHELIGPLLAE